MTEDEAVTGAAVAGGRFLRRVTAVEAARGLGLACIAASILGLSRPVSLLLFSANGDTFPRGVESWVGSAQLVTGLLGLALFAVSTLRRLSAWLLPVRRGDLVLLTVAFLVVFGLAEGLVRYQGARQWGSATRTPLSFDVMGAAGGGQPLRPGVFAQRALSDFDPAYDRVILATINRFGLRGPLPAAAKPASRSRIIALGGSTTFGYMVQDGEDWPSQLALLLGEGYEVLNAGRPGATTFRNFAFLRDHLLQLDPDVVVLYEGFNDMWRGVRRHAGDQPDYGVVDEALPASPGPLDQGDPVAWPWRPSFLAYHVARRLAAPWRPSWPEPPIGDGPFRFDPAVVSIYERNLGAMVRLCRNRGVRPLIVTFAGCDDASASPGEQERRMAYVRRSIPQLDTVSGRQAMEIYRDVTRRVARELGVPLVDLARLMTKDLDAYADTVHFTPAGERRVAEILARTLRAGAFASAESTFDTSVGVHRPARSGAYSETTYCGQRRCPRAYQMVRPS